MSSAAGSIDNLTLTVTYEIEVEAPLDVAFAVLLDQIGPENVKPDGTPMPMKLEAWPGGAMVPRFG